MILEQAKVAISRCPDYTSGLDEALKTLLGHLGGIDRFIKPGQTVLIKPNLLTDRKPEEAVTTHPELVRCVIRLLRAHNASVLVADSPANAVKLDRVWEKTGFATMCAEEDVPLVSLEKSDTKTITIAGVPLSMPRPVMEADAIINMPKVKTHALTMLTAGIKNMYGTIPGFQKTRLHMQYPKPKQFSEFLAGFFKQVQPTLTIADAVVGMEGNGPSAGRPVKLGFLAASSNTIALDVALCNILNIPIRHVPYLVLLAGKHLDRPGKTIEIVGTSIEDVKPIRFRLPGTLAIRLIPQRLVRFLGPYIWIRPQVTESCAGCRQCVDACPADALIFNGQRQRPILHSDKCIECCCCHEVCPERAIKMQPSPLVRIFRFGRNLDA